MQVTQSGAMFRERSLYHPGERGLILSDGRAGQNFSPERIVGT